MPSQGRALSAKFQVRPPADAGSAGGGRWGERVTELDALVDEGPDVQLRSATLHPYDGAISAARTCYSPRVIAPEEVTAGQRQRIGPLTYEGGHHTVFQHATFEFALSGLSRQLVWSFLHAFPFYNTEQQSQRYVRLDRVSAHIPPVLSGRAREIYTDSIQASWRTYAELGARLEPRAHEILGDLWRLKDRQNRAFGKNVAREAEKKAIETARYAIPIACHTAMVYTVSGLVLHRLQRMVRVGDAPQEATEVVSRMVAEVERVDPDFFGAVGESALEDAEVLESQVAPSGLGDPALLEAFDKSLDGHTSRLVDWSARGPEVVAAAVRQVLGRADLDDADALALALDPARNPYRLERLNVSGHAPLMRALAHVHYVFRKKLSHTADSQDQRHRTVPGSRPLLSRSVPGHVDVVVPELIGQDPVTRNLFLECCQEQWYAREQLLSLGVAPELALYVLPNALALRFEESGTLLDLLHKWTMRSCLNAQREIWQASMDEIEQVRAVHPELMEHVGPPCFVRNGHARPRCTEGSHFCGIPVWRTFPEIQRPL